MRPPDIGLLFGVVVIAVIGVVFARHTVSVVGGHDASALIGACVGAVVGIGGIGLWAYAYTQNYEVSPPAVRLIQGYGLLTFAATIAAFIGELLPPTAQGFSASIVTITLLALIPLTVVGWWRGRKDSEIRELLGMKAFMLLRGQAKHPRAKSRHR